MLTRRGSPDSIWPFEYIEWDDLLREMKHMADSFCGAERWVFPLAWWKSMGRPATLLGLPVQVDPALKGGFYLVPRLGWCIWGEIVCSQ